MISQILPSRPWSVDNLTDREFKFWNFKKAAALSHSVPAILKVELQTDKVSHSVSGPLELLAYNEWHQAVQQLKFPNGRNQALSDADLEAYHLIANLPPGGHISPDTMKKHWAGDPPLEAGVESLIFANHQDPESYKITSQRVRFPDEILPLMSRIRARIQKQVGTCIDFVLVFCAILERLGLSPLIIVVEHGGHAIAGCWMNDRPTFKGGIVYRDKEEIKKLKNENRIFGIDVTEYAKNKPYKEAVDKGQSYLDCPESFCYAVDLQAARDASIGPLVIVLQGPPILKILALLAVFIAAAVAIWVLSQHQKPALTDVDVLKMLRTGGATISCLQEKDIGKAEYGWEDEHLKVHYDLQKGYVACWITFSSTVTSDFKTLVVKAEGDPATGVPKEFTIELKTPDPQMEPRRYRISPSSQSIEKPIVGLREIRVIAIVFYEDRVGVKKGAINIDTLELISQREEDKSP